MLAEILVDEDSSVVEDADIEEALENKMCLTNSGKVFTNGVGSSISLP